MRRAGMTGNGLPPALARASFDGTPRRDSLPLKKARAGRRHTIGPIYLSPDIRLEVAASGAWVAGDLARSGSVRAGESRVLVVRGEPGVGKTALLDYLAWRASGCRVARAAGVQSEMGLAFAGLRQLCAPMLDRLDRLPGPQREAMQTAFGLSAGPPPDRFLVGLAVLGLLSEIAAGKPLICVVDDERWLDRASAQALGFVARRLAADPVGLVFATRAPPDELGLGLLELVVEGLREQYARTCWTWCWTGSLDVRVRDEIVAETLRQPAGAFGVAPQGRHAGRNRRAGSAA